MPARTPEKAADWLCPLSLAFGTPEREPGCRGAVCALWRWDTTQPWVDAVRQVAAEIGEKEGNKPRSARIVADNPLKYGLEGHCGLGGPL